MAGLTHHPVEVITVTDDQAHELFTIAHREQAAHQPADNEQDTEAST